MRYLIKDQESGLYVGSHSHEWLQLQNREHAYSLKP